MFTLNDVLERAVIRPEDVNVMLHSPNEGDLQTFLPGLVRTRPRALEVYQAAHSEGAARTLNRNRPWVASFVKTGVGRAQATSSMLFAGLFRNKGSIERARADIEADPELQWLNETFDYFSQLADPGWQTWTWFDLTLDETLSDLRGRLLVEVRLTPNYVRLAENLNAPISAIHAESVFDAAPPSWRRMRPSAGMLRALPPSWASKLAEWRGIYLIVDESDGAQYVGSACGAENFLGRWREHVARDRGVTVGLRDRNPAHFRFSILERVSPDAALRDVSRLEQTWMERLHTVRFGLNRPQDPDAGV